MLGWNGVMCDVWCADAGTSDATLSRTARQLDSDHGAAAACVECVNAAGFQMRLTGMTSEQYEADAVGDQLIQDLSTCLDVTRFVPRM